MFRKAQATAEIAIIGSILIFLIGYLASQGFLYNSRQALEMYTFRKALELSKAQERGISLTVIRDVFPPSFFSSLNRSRTMASSSVEVNPYVVWVAKEGEPNDMSTKHYLQIGDAMIGESGNQGAFFEIPPTLMKVDTKDGEDEEFLWTPSSIREFDSQIVGKTEQASYSYITDIKEDKAGKTSRRLLTSQDKIEIPMTFETAEKVREDYFKDDVKGEVLSVEVKDVPRDINLVLEEIVRRERVVSPK